MKFSAIQKKSLIIKSRTYIKTIKEVTELLKKEHGKIGNQTVSGHLVKLNSDGEALIIGDLHGDLESLSKILEESNFLSIMKKDERATLIFLGDYGDRGTHSAEIYYVVSKLKLAFPKQVILLRGNHESPDSLMGHPHDLPRCFQTRFGKNWQKAYDETRKLSGQLYNAVFVKGQFLMLHGGLSPKLRRIEDLAKANEISSINLLEDILWSDPKERIAIVHSSPRGAGKVFGPNLTEKLLTKLDVKILIRGHQASRAGFKINHKGRILTLFSRKGPPYSNPKGAYLQLPLSQKFEDATQLIPWIHQF